jgi:hypothetical protein
VLAETALTQELVQVQQEQATKPAGESAKTGTLPNTAPRAESKTVVKPESEHCSWVQNLLNLLTIILSWPAIVVVLLVFFLFSWTAPYRVRRLLKPFRSLKLFGTEFVLSEEVGTDAEQAIEILRKQVKRQFDTLIEINDIRAKLEEVIGQIKPFIFKRGKINSLRCTLHVPDILFADTLYQLLDYYPLGGGRGRTFSSRFGIIGLCWRSRMDQIKGMVPTDSQKLILEWGMTNEQAAGSGEGRQSFLALVLRDESESAVAIFYMDAKEENVFGADAGDEEFRSTLKQKITQESERKGLIVSLAKMRDALSDRRPAIHIHEQ